MDYDGVVKDVYRIINAQTPTYYDLLSPDFDILQAIRTKLSELPILGQTSHMSKDTKTEPNRGTNSTFEQKSMCLLTDKLTKSTRNNQGGLNCSRPGSLAPALLTANDKKLPKASLHTFGMHLTCRQ
jgi:hypothetical protein